jgi:cytochrome oxidase Cu insertion factor (SCO1/SenC/PrrC family)
MNHSLLDADRNTHFRIIAVALVSAIVLIVVGLMARVDNSATATAQLHANGPVVKVGKPMTVTIRDGATVR